MSDRPLHVQVAEALGWTETCLSGWVYLGANAASTEDRREWVGFAPLQDAPGRQPILRYDTDWSATGPLIEKYEIDLVCCVNGWKADWYGPHGSSESPDLPGEGAYETPLLAVCRMVLQLKEAGKLG